MKPHVFIWIPEDIVEEEGDPDFDRAGNAGFVVTGEGVVVVDTTDGPFHARELLYEIRQRTDQPVKYVIDTDSSGDQVLGNEVFLDQQARILSTPDVQAQMRRREQELVEREANDWRLQRRMRGIHVTPPGQTFDGEKQLTLGGQEIRLVSLKTADSGTDAAVYLPAAKVLFLGDLFDNAYFPRLAAAPQPWNVHRCIEALRQVEGWDVDVYVPGHGDPGGKKELAQFRQFLEWLTNEVENRIEARKALDEVKRELLPEMRNYHWHAPELAPDTIEDVYRQLGGTVSSVR